MNTAKMTVKRDKIEADVNMAVLARSTIEEGSKDDKPDRYLTALPGRRSNTPVEQAFHWPARQLFSAD